MRALAVLSILLLLPSAARAAAAATAATGAGQSYVLVTPPSNMEVGCQGPCECPILPMSLHGTFALTPAPSDPLYAYYVVSAVAWQLDDQGQAVPVSGSGLYKVGGEVAYLQELTLDLSVGGQPAEHFDSGLVPITAPFPALSIRCAVHGFYCYDSVLTLQAVPSTAGTGPPAAAPRLSVGPNPFRAALAIGFTLAREGRASLVVLDAAGRRVRTLLPGQTLGPGTDTVTWDGRDDDGRSAPPGLYLVRLRTDEGQSLRRVIRLR